MFLRHKEHDDMVEVLSLNDLFDLYNSEIIGRYQAGEEVQDPERFKKSELVFLSGENLPRCWTEPHYRDDEIKR